FLVQAGWDGPAERELEALLRDFPSLKERVEPLQESLKKLRALRFVEGLERAHKIGQHNEVLEGLEQYAKQGMAALVGDRAVQVQALKLKYDAAKEKLAEARRSLKELPDRAAGPHKRFFAEAADAILEELNFDTLPRLETFLGQAKSLELALKQKRKPDQSA